MTHNMTSPADTTVRENPLTRTLRNATDILVNLTYNNGNLFFYPFFAVAMFEKRKDKGCRVGFISPAGNNFA